MVAGKKNMKMSKNQEWGTGNGRGVEIFKETVINAAGEVVGFKVKYGTKKKKVHSLVEPTSQRGSSKENERFQEMDEN